MIPLNSTLKSRVKTYYDPIGKENIYSIPIKTLLKFCYRQKKFLHEVFGCPMPEKRENLYEFFKAKKNLDLFKLTKKTGYSIEQINRILNSKMLDNTVGDIMPFRYLFRRRNIFDFIYEAIEREEKEEILKKYEPSQEELEEE